MKYLLILSLALSACGHGPSIKQDIKNCAEGQAGAAAPDVRVLVDLLLAGQDWKTGLDALARIHTAGFVTCVVQSIIFTLQSEKGLDAVRALKISHGQAWISAQK